MQSWFGRRTRWKLRASKNSSMSLLRLVLCWGIVFAAAVRGQVAAADGRLDYGRDIRPILADNCFRCHGPDAKQRQAGLRLDLRDEAIKRLESDAVAIVPGKPDSSALVSRIRATDESERMPPADSQKKLTSEQKGLLQRWIAEGASYAEHWSFITPRKSALPPVS